MVAPGASSALHAATGDSAEPGGLGHEPLRKGANFEGEGWMQRQLIHDGPWPHVEPVAFYSHHASYAQSMYVLVKVHGI